VNRAASHFEDLEKQSHAARLGMWVFLGSEVLFFSGLFALYAGYRTEHPHGFDVGVQHNTIVYGSVNTAVLLVSSYTIAMSVHMVRIGRRLACELLIGGTLLLGLCFLGIKLAEYLKHFSDGIYPGGWGRFFEAHPEPGTKMFFTLYYCMTGLHAAHVFAGMCVLTMLLVKVHRRQVDAEVSYPLELGAVYWHLVDVIWIFLWPLFYLVTGHVR
jgi:cytochrome c oxidase subunit III